MAVSTEKVAEQYLNVSAGVPIDVDFPLFVKSECLVLYGNVGVGGLVLNTDYSITLGNENNEWHFTLTPLAPLITKINNLIVADPDEINRIVVRRVMPYTTVTTPGAVSGTRFTSTEFDRTAMKFMQIAEGQERNIQLSPAYVNAQVPYLTLGDEGTGLMFGPDNTIIPGPPLDAIGDVPGLAAQVVIDAAQVADDRIAVHADMLAADASADSAADSAAVAIQTKGIYRGAWVTATTYAQYDQVRSGTAVYTCLIAHTSGTFATDLSNGKWAVYLQDGPAGAGSGDMSKSTYDPNNKNGDTFSMANQVESLAGSGHLKMTSAERTKLSGIEAAADVTDLTNVGSSMAGASTKATPVDADGFWGTDSAASNVGKRFLWSAIKATLKAYFDTLYAAISHTHSFADITSKPTTRAGYGIQDDAAPAAPGGGAKYSYCFAYHSGSAQYTIGEETPGSFLLPCNSDDAPSKGTQRSGVWQCMGQTNNAADAGDRRVTLWLRIS